MVMADYGGFAGLKSVNLRGLGSPHTAVCIDGVRMGNVQSGQPDLGILGLENFSGAVIDYAQNSVNFTTRRPAFRDGPVAGEAAFGAGSFGTWMPRGRLDFRFSDRVSLSANAAGIVSEGNFGLADGTERANNDIRLLRGGIDLFGILDGGEWIAKAYCNASDRGTPGSVDWPSADRQCDRNFFVQGILRKNFSPLYSMNVSAKASRDNVLYKSEWGDSDYAQTEAQLNYAGKFHVLRWLDLSAVAELLRDFLTSSLYEASRTGVTAIAGAAVKFQRLHADVTVQYEGVFDRGEASRNVVSPSLDIRYTVSDGLDIVGFARRAYRAPTFNELYYPGYGNPALAPEDAWLRDIGADWRLRSSGPWSFKAKLDGFCNSLTDKIVSAPSSSDPSVWLPYNIGEVRSVGVDADSKVSYAKGEWKASASARYSFQSADNVPYLSKHTVVLAADASCRGWRLDAVWNFRAGRTDSFGEMPDWNSLDILAAKSFPIAGGRDLAVKFNFRNIFDCRYELVSGYPMPGRSILGTMEYHF